MADDTVRPSVPMTPRQRVWAALRGEAVDRPPMSFWGHVYHRESTAEDLVAATLELQSRYGWDWVKLNPRKHYHVEPWGVRYAYSGTPGAKPVLESWPVHAGADWSRITPQPHDAGALGEQLEAVRMLKRDLPADVPLIETVFTPLAVLGEMVRTPQELKSHLESHPAVTATFERFVPAVLAAGADGVYFATVDWATRDLMSAGDYRRWARPWDLRVLRAAAGAPFNVLHVCRRNNLLLELADYPVAAFSWAATDPTNPSLAEGLARLPGAVMGGIAHEGALEREEPDAALDQLRRAFEETGGRRWLAAPGCSIAPLARAGHLAALRWAVDAMPVASGPRAPSGESGGVAAAEHREARP
jgi:uroporphyrinogen decarboxylase